jgi:hypothetical protein
VILGGVALGLTSPVSGLSLRQRSGPDYERAIQTARTPAEAEAMLHAPARRRSLQAGAVTEADALATPSRKGLRQAFRRYRVFFDLRV